MEGILQRFKEYLETNKISYYKAERDLGLGNGAIGKMFKRESSMKADLIQNILATYKDIDKEWFLGEKVIEITNMDDLKKENEILRIKLSSALKEVASKDEVIKSKDELINQLIGRDLSKRRLG